MRRFTQHHFPSKLFNHTTYKSGAGFIQHHRAGAGFSLFFGVIICLFVFWPQNNAQAGVKLLDISQSHYLDLGNGLSIEFINWDKSNTKWGIEVKEPDQNNIQRLGIYPSYKAVEYRLHILSGSLLNYQSVDAINNWQSLDQIITDNKILLKPVDAVAPIVLGDKEIISTDNKLKIFSHNQATIAKSMAPVENDGKRLISSIYKITNANINDQIQFSYDIIDDYSKSIYQYDYQAKQWQELFSYNDLPEKIISANISQNTATVAIFADLVAQDGIASFYDQGRYRAFNYQNGNFAASRDYPKGTKLKVTRLKTGESVIVEVNDYGPELKTGRLIDLDITAFEKIGSRVAGLIYVKVEPYDSR